MLHIIPHPKMHGLRGYKDVIDTVAWGLGKLGHQVTYALNQFHPTATNIVFGAQMLSIDGIKNLPDNSICYHLEQIRNLEPSQLKAEMCLCAERFEIWEYSSVNLPTWEKVGYKKIKLVPVGYAPILSRISKAPLQDIDVLLYGLTGQSRMIALHQLSHAGLTVVFLSGLYGDARDQLISRAKIVLNVNLYEFSQIFEIVRVSYLLANRKAVVATKDPDTFVEQDIGEAVKFTTIERLVEDCQCILADDRARAEMEDRGFGIIARRDIREILRGALNDNTPDQ